MPLIAEISVQPRREIAGWMRRRRTHVAEIPCAVARRDVQGTAERHRQVCVVVATMCRTNSSISCRRCTIPNTYISGTECRLLLRVIGYRCGLGGPTICYAFMQAVGIVNDHVTGCFRYDEV